jgi:ADP-ribose pyrophosphatase
MHLESRQLLKTARFSVDQVTRTLGDGSLHHRQIVRHPGAVTILPMVDDEHLCLIRNYRVSVDETLIELPAGTREPDEAAEATAHRELIEETGYEAGHLSLLHRFLLSPGILDERMILFLATDLRVVGSSREVGEEIENLVVPFTDAIDMIQDGRIQDAKTIVGILTYQQFHQCSG